MHPVLHGRNYIIASQAKPRIEVFTRQDDGAGLLRAYARFCTRRTLGRRRSSHAASKCSRPGGTRHYTSGVTRPMRGTPHGSAIASSSRPRCNWVAVRGSSVQLCSSTPGEHFPVLPHSRSLPVDWRISLPSMGPGLAQKEDRKVDHQGFPRSHSITTR